MSHTLGPWETIFDGALAAHKEHWRVISSTSGLTLAVMEFGKAAEANARLIAAAPDLRAALEALVENVHILWEEPKDTRVWALGLKKMDEVLCQARAALAGAGGEASE